jgi:deazaflavin-dependent oxidoreductase (nitroreductase family)
VSDEPALADLDYCYLTTTGRHTGTPHRIEIWFALADGVVYLLSGGGDRSDWVRNLMISPEVVIEIGGRRRTRRARIVTDHDEDASARALVVGKYAPRYRGDLADWGRTSLPIAVEWEAEENGS